MFHSLQAISRKENKQCNSPEEGESAASVRLMLFIIVYYY